MQWLISSIDHEIHQKTTKKKFKWSIPTFSSGNWSSLLFWCYQTPKILTLSVNIRKSWAPRNEQMILKIFYVLLYIYTSYFCFDSYEDKQHRRSDPASELNYAWIVDHSSYALWYFHTLTTSRFMRYFFCNWNWIQLIVFPYNFALSSECCCWCGGFKLTPWAFKRIGLNVRIDFFIVFMLLISKWKKRRKEIKAAWGIKLIFNKTC